MQMRDSGDAIELTAELPGIEPDKVKVELEDDMLTISGEAEAREEREDAQIERYVSFYRQIALPDGVDAEQAQASYNNGVLTIRFPKHAERSNAKQIPVTTGQSAQQGGQQPGQAAGQQSKDKAA
jgi:HSP20 family protein